MAAADVAAARAREPTRACTPCELAWLATIPCALVVLAAIVVLGAPLGDALLAPRGMAFWPSAQASVLPEPAEHARYLLALIGPLLVSGAVLLAARRPRGVAPGVVRPLVAAAQALTVAFLLACLWIERTSALAPAGIDRRAYFTPATLLVAACVAAGGALALSRPQALRRAAAPLRDTPRRRLAALAIAVLLIALWLLTAVNSDATIGAARPAVVGANLSNWLDEAAAVLNGRPPLVDLRAQYAQLWPYLSAGAMTLLGTSLSVYVGTMLAGTAAALLAVLALLRRVAGSWLAALALFAPFLATSFFLQAGSLADRYSPVQLFSLFPMRYGGAYLLAWLTIRHVGGARPRRRAPLFLAAGLVTLNNVEFGLPALGATLAAVVWTDPPRSWAGAARLLGDVALGLAGALALVAALTLAVAGSLPDLGLALTFPRIFGIEGFGMLPMRTLGLHLVLYATFAAAIVVATVQALRGDRATPLTAALAWSGVFGLGAGAYYAGRSHPEVLIGLFSAWALALALLLVVVVRAAAAQQVARRRPALAELALLAAAGLAVCSLAQLPTPWSQLDRLGRTTPAPVLRPLDQERAIAAQTAPGEPVALLVPVGHRLADDVGIVDVTPYADVRFVAQRQLTDTVAALRAAGGTQLILARWLVGDEQLAALLAAGFRQTGELPEVGLVTLADTRSR